MKAILYNSQGGTTIKYAQKLADELNIPAFTLLEADNALKDGTEVIFLSWIMAGHLVDYKRVKSRFDIKCVFAVGLNYKIFDTEVFRKKNKIKSSIAIYPLPGGYRPDRIKGLKRFLLGVVIKREIKKLEVKENLTDSEKDTLYVYKNGGDFVDLKLLDSIIPKFL